MTMRILSGILFISLTLAGIVSIAPADNSQVVSFTALGSVQTGQTFTAQLVLKNTGSTTWDPATGYKLGASSPRDNITWGKSRWPLLPAAVPPGGQTTITLICTAPGSTGTYILAAEMLREGIAWFGGPSGTIPGQVASMPITVTQAMPQPVGYPEADSVHILEILNTGALPTPVAKLVTWANQTGKRQRIREIRVWHGFGSFASKADIDCSVTQIQPGGGINQLCHFQWDRYALPTGPWRDRRTFPIDYNLIIPVGGEIRVGLITNVTQGEATTSHFVVDVGFQAIP